MRRLIDNGDVTRTTEKKFYQAVRSFYCTAVAYALKNLPLNDKVLQNAQFVNFSSREEALFSQVEYFVNRSATTFTTNNSITYFH